MLVFLIRHSSEIRYVWVASALAAALYTLWVSTASQQRNHLALTRIVAWAARAGWLESMQAAIRWVLDIMSVIYGSPNFVSKNGPRRFMTLRAWRISAWIASMYVFVLAPVALATLIVAKDSTGGRFNWSAFLGALFLYIAAAVTLFAHLYVLRNYVRTPARMSATLLFRRFVLGVYVGIAASIVVIIAGILLYWISGPTRFADVGTAMWAALIFALIAYGLLRGITNFGFYAPLALLAQLMLSAVFILVVTTAVWEIRGSLKDFPPASTDARAFAGLTWLFHLSLVIAVMGFLVYPILNFSRVSARGYGYLTLCAGLLGTIGVFAFANVGSVTDTPMEIDFLLQTLRVFMKNGGVYILLLYGAIFANSVPDWLSVGLTRFVLEKAAGTRSILSFLKWLGAEIGSAIVCLVLSNLIISFAMILSLYALSGVHLGHLNKLSHTDLHQMQFFAGGYYEWAVPIGIFEDGPAKTWANLTSKNIPESIANGMIFAFVASALVCTALIPTILSVLTLIALSVARAFALVVVPAFRILHKQLLIEQDSTKIEVALSYARSAAIFGFFGATMFSAALWAIDGFPWPLR